jgi:hypothetical protein
MEHVVQHAISRDGVTHRGHSRARTAGVRLAMIVAAAVMVAACREDEYSSRITGPPVTNAVAPSLVGLWKGPVSGPGGSGLVTLRLQADSTMAADNENPIYTRLTGVWSVAGARFTATGRTPLGTVVTLVAPFVSTVRLTGTWSANNGASGTFEAVKQ